MNCSAEQTNRPRTASQCTMHHSLVSYPQPEYSIRGWTGGSASPPPPAPSSLLEWRALRMRNFPLFPSLPELPFFLPSSSSRPPSLLPPTHLPLPFTLSAPRPSFNSSSRISSESDHEKCVFDSITHECDKLD